MPSFRLASGIAVLVLTIAPCVPLATAESDVTLRLEPHCTNQDRTDCPQFDVADALHLTTGRYAAGDIVDIDVVLIGEAGKSIQLIRSWLQYDPQILEARSVDLTPAIAQPIPGEQTFDAQAGLIKIGGNAALNLSNDRVSIARITFRVISATQNTTLSFVNYQENGSGQTAVNAAGSGASLPVMHGNPSMLKVKLADATASESSASSVSSSANSEPAPVIEQIQNSSSAAATSAFSLLQVQDVRVTSHESSIFLGWLPLRSSELKGYNVYYGTVSGKYMQRRSIPSTATSLVIRDLTSGTPYYLAIRGVNQSEQESVFSQEVSVTVGDPDTSTSPLVAGIDGFDRLTTGITPAPKGNPIQTRGGNEVSGTTGTGDTVLFLAMFSGLIGTTFAVHRQRAMFSRNNVA